MNPKRLTIRTVNNYAHNYELHLVKGDGYFFWVSDLLPLELLETTSVMVYRINDLTLEGWISEIYRVIERVREAVEDRKANRSLWDGKIEI